MIKETARNKPEELLENPVSSKDYNVTRNGERDSSKTFETGQSAAELLSQNDMKKVQRLTVGSKRSRSIRQARKLESARKRGRWARNYDKCEKCSTTEIVHEAKGLCELCYRKKSARDRTKANPNWYKEYFQSISKDSELYKRQVERSRNWKANNIERNRQYARDYYANNRDSELLKKNEANHGGYYLVVLERDNFTCQRCGEHPVFLVHHKDPETRNNNPKLQITLCLPCHTSIHRTKDLNEQDKIDFFV